jgi:hypothetical protein
LLLRTLHLKLNFKLVVGQVQLVVIELVVELGLKLEAIRLAAIIEQVTIEVEVGVS